MLVLKSRSAPVTALAFSPDGRWLAAGGMLDSSRVDVWDPAGSRTTPARVTPRMSGPVVGIGYAPGGRVVAVSQGEEVVRFAPPDGRLDPTPGPRAGSAHAARVFPDGGQALVSGRRLWACVLTGRPRQAWSVEPGPGALFAGIAVHPGGELFAAALVRNAGARRGPAFDHELWVGRAADGRTVQALGIGRGRIDSLDWSPDGSRLAGAVDGAVWVWDAATGRAVAGPLAAPGRAVMAVRFHPGGRLATAEYGADPAVRLWDADAGREAAAYAWPVGIGFALAFAPDGCRAAAGGAGGEIVVWDVDG